VTLGLGFRGVARAYRARAAGSSGMGSVSGTISARSALRDSVVAVTHDPKICGDSASVHESRADKDGSLLANVLVWVEGISAGKPLSDVRRETLTIERCQFEPRVLAVTTGSTINIFSRDRVVHDARFYREGAHAPVARVHTVDAGQVVPSEKVASVAGIVEVRCAEHPWARAYIAVFDHPYFAVTDQAGAFRIDSLPPGTYVVKVWQERLAAPIQQRVVIEIGGTGRLDLSLALR
jgi:hypothetical protein